MSAEDNSSADSADIGEALVAALGFEPTDGRKRRGGSGGGNEEEPSVDDAFVVVPSGPSAEVPSEADLKALAQPAVTVNGTNGSTESAAAVEVDSDPKSVDSDPKSDGASGSGGDAVPEVSTDTKLGAHAVADTATEAKTAPAKSESTKSASDAGSGSGSDADADAGTTQNRSAQSRKSKRRRNRNRNTNSKSSSRSQGPAKMADKPPSDDEPIDLKSAAKPAVSELPQADGADSWDMSESGKAAAESVSAPTEPSREVKAKVDEITAEAITSVAGKSKADLELDKSFEESQAAARAEADAAIEKSKQRAQAERSSSKAAKANESAKSNESGSRSSAAPDDTVEGTVSDTPDDKAVDAGGDVASAAAAAVTADITEIVLPSHQPPPPTAADAIKVVQPAPDGTMPAGATGSNVDELLADTLTDVPSAPPTRPVDSVPAAPVAPVADPTVPLADVATPGVDTASPGVETVSPVVDPVVVPSQPTPAQPAPAAVPATAEAPPAKADSVPTGPPSKVLPKNRLEVKDDEVAAKAEVEAKLETAKTSSGFDFSLPNVLRRKRRVQARKVRRVVRHIDPWSVLTFSVLFHLSVFAALLLASVLVWNAAEAAGTIENMEAFILDLGDYETFEIKGDVVFRAAVAIAGILTLASSVLLVLLTVVFNLISDLVGGIRLTVIEEETVRVRRKKKT